MRNISLAMTLIIANFLLLIAVNSTRLTFYIDHQVEQPLDYVEINAVIKAKGDSLDQTLEEAAGTIAKIQSLVDGYCKIYTPKNEQKRECSEMIEVSPYSIKPQYELLKKKELFGGFVVAHEIFLRVKETEGFGKLIDDIMKIGVNKINSLEWKPKEEVSGEEIALVEGTQQAHEICKKIGSKLAKIISVQQVTDFGQDEEEEEGDDNKQQDEDEERSQEDDQPLDIKDGITYYKFVVECQRTKSK